jgi:hypothetical protein
LDKITAVISKTVLLRRDEEWHVVFGHWAGPLVLVWLTILWGGVAVILLS